MNDYWIKRVSELEEEVNFLRAYKKKANETIQNLMYKSNDTRAKWKN
jgi:hypothetical protein